MTKSHIALLVIAVISLCTLSFGGGYYLMGSKVETGKQFIYGNASHKCKVTNKLVEDSNVSK